MNEFEHPVYTAGYAGRTAAEMLSAVTRLGAILVDIRYSPGSRMEEWRRDSLLSLFGEDHYRWCHAFGNKSYNGGTIELVDPARGIETISRLVLKAPVILLCGCKNYSTCHRAVVADLLRWNGLDVSELEW